MMNKFKRMAAVILACSALGSTALAAMTDSETYQKRLGELMLETGIMQGTDDAGSLDMDREITRAEALTLIERACCVQFAKQADPGDPVFTDAKGHWAEGIIMRFYNNGYINGVTDTAFEPDRAIKAAEFAKILLSCIGYNIPDLETAGQYVRSGDVFTRGDAAEMIQWVLGYENADEKKPQYMVNLERGMMTTEEKLLELAEYDTCVKTATVDSFSDKMNKQMSAEENYMFSPISIQMATAMAANGAEGETKREILDAVSIEELDEFNESSKKFMQSCRDTKAVQLEIANSLWTNTSMANVTFNKNYVGKMKDFYDAEVREESKDTIVPAMNGWASEKTHGKISQIADEHIKEDPMQTHFLVNSVYFKGKWVNEFKKEATKEQVFYNYDGTETETDFMNLQEGLSYGQYGSARVVRLPYKNYTVDGEEVHSDAVRLSMYVLLAPERIENPEHILDKTVWLPGGEVVLAMPKFEMEYDLDLKKILNEFGMEKAFIPKTAEFAPIINEPDGWFFLSTSKQKSYIKVDEEGTEAAAVTIYGGGGGSSAMVRPVYYMTLDHPFSYIIRDDITGNVLFVGQINTMDL